MPKVTRPIEIVNDRLKKVRWKEFVCGWGAACVNITVTYPINKIILRQMLSGVTIKNAFSQLRTEGVFYLYRGMLPPLMQKTLSLSIMFGVYEEVRRSLMDEARINPYYAKAIAGLVAGSTEAILMPFERIQTVLIDASHHKRFKNTFHAFQSIGVQYGLREYYRGLVPILLRNGPSNVCFFILRDEFQMRMKKSDSVLNQSIQEFLCGALIGVLLSTMFFPLNVVKISMQSQIGGKFKSIFTVFTQVYRDRGGTVRNFYYGVNASIIRSFFSWGIMNCAYIYLKDFIN
ncbi:solute carrier family 25 member 51 isoform X1 [Photinus pyralis]|uniref:Solute carrier family 25 member 51 n=1 Tax=Photinus pyralis TaxID=7054 RepID=A0A1Y1LSU1_PHOPY|nr:solute carrier family 25 member 51 isoform X1 [Photinus pyralis]